MNKYSYSPAASNQDSKLKTFAYAVATLAVFAAMGVMMAWRG